MHRRPEPSKKLAILALAERSYPDELLADFQQYYGLNLWSMNLGRDGRHSEAARAATLAAQLPRDSRVMRRLNPVGQHGTEAMLLRQIELDLRSIAGTKDGSDPQPLLLEGEEEAHERAVEVEEANAEEMARTFGLRI